MVTLALDTTTRAGSVAVLRGDALLSVVHGDAARTHGERLPGEMAEALREAHVAAGALELLVVASGPGAFTGLRIGLAAVQGLAMALDVPVVGVSALEALAASVLEREPGEGGALQDGGAIVSWMDAQRGEVFEARYQTRGGGIHAAGEPVVGQPRALLPKGGAEVPLVFVGDGAVRHRTEIESHFEGRTRVLVPPEALAPVLARLGIARALAGEAGSPHALQPLYVRRSDAELERQRRVGS